MSWNVITRKCPNNWKISIIRVTFPNDHHSKYYYTHRVVFMLHHIICFISVVFLDLIRGRYSLFVSKSGCIEPFCGEGLSSTRLRLGRGCSNVTLLSLPSTSWQVNVLFSFIWTRESNVHFFSLTYLFKRLFHSFLGENKNFLPLFHFDLPFWAHSSYYVTGVLLLAF